MPKSARGEILRQVRQRTELVRQLRIIALAIEAG
jgi:hypothetical protein